MGYRFFRDFDKSASYEYPDAAGWGVAPPQIAKIPGLEVIAYSEAIDVIVSDDISNPINTGMISSYWRLTTNLPAYPTMIIAERMVEEILALTDVSLLESLLRVYEFESIDD